MQLPVNGFLEEPIHLVAGVLPYLGVKRVIFSSICFGKVHRAAAIAVERTKKQL
jgi:hypothetical protein